MGLPRLYDSNGVLVKRDPSLKFSSAFTLTPEAGGDLVDVALADGGGSLSARADWYVDGTSGNDATGDGTSGAPYKTETKLAAATAGLVATVFVTLHFLNMPATANPECTFAELRLGGRMIGTAAAIVGSPTVLTTAGAESLSGTGTARKITSAGAVWSSLQNGNGQGPRIHNTTKGTYIWGTAAESATVYRVGPAYAANGAALVLPTSGTFTESADADALVCETLPIVNEVKVRGTLVPYGKFLVVEGFETNGGNQTFTSYQAAGVVGGGQLVYLNCGIGAVLTASGNAIFINCRVDQMGVHGGITDLFGCVIFWSLNHASGELNYHGCLSGGVPLNSYGDGANVTSDATLGIFDCVDFYPGSGALDMTYAAIRLTAVAYGSRNTYFQRVHRGGSVNWTAAHAPIGVGETNHVRLASSLLTNAQVPATFIADGSKSGLEDGEAVLVSGASVAQATTGGTWNPVLAPQAHCLATANCSFAVSAGADTMRARMEFVPTTAKTLTLTGVTFTTQFTQAALTTLCGTAVRIFVYIENIRGVWFVVNVVSAAS